jgi:putative flippase GtrA
MQVGQTIKWESGMAVKFAAVGLIGLLTDVILLRLGMAVGMSAAIARVISLLCAMQVTFTVNGLMVFRCLTWRKLARQWAGYMATNGFGNFCNYWIFVTLVSFHRPIVSNPYVALPVGALCAYLINYAGARLLVFGKGRARVPSASRRRALAGVGGGLAPAASPPRDLAMH